MPFVPDAHFEKKEKQEEMRDQIMKKKELAFINDQAKEGKPEPKQPIKMDNAKVIKAILKNTNLAPREKPKVLTLKDIKNSLQIDKLIEDEKEKAIVEILDNAEMQELKGEFVNVLALTHANPIKRKIFAYKLQHSNTINSYVDNNVILRMFNKANENIKFAVVYGVKYLETNKDYDAMVLHAKMREEELKKQKKKEEEEKEKEKKEEPKQEPEEGVK